MNMISFSHFENFNKQPEGFKSGLEMEEGDFNSFLLFFNFGQTSEQPDNPNFELSQLGETASTKTISDAELNAEGTDKQTRNFKFVDEIFLANEKPNLIQNKEINEAEFEETSSTDKKNALNLPNFKESKNMDSAEKENFPQKPSVANQPVVDPEFLKADESLSSNKAESEDWVIQKDSALENISEAESPNSIKIEGVEKAFDEGIKSVRKQVSEAEIEEIMKSRFSAEFSADEPAITDKPENLSAEKIDLWQFKSPDFQTFDEASNTETAETDAIEFESLKSSERPQNLKEAENQEPLKSAENNSLKTAEFTEDGNESFLKENKLKVEVPNPQKNAASKLDIADVDSAFSPERVAKNSGDVKPTNPGEFAVEEMIDLESVGQKENEPQQNFSNKLNELFAPGKKEIDLQNGVDIITNENPKAGERLDLGEKRITNLSNSNPSPNPVNQTPIDLGERAASKLPTNPVPPPIHRQDLGERAPNNLTNKFTKLIRKVSEAFDLSGSSNEILELNINEAEITPENQNVKTAETFNPELEEKIKRAQPNLPSPHNDKTQTPDILSNETGIDAPKRQPMRVDTKTPDILPIDPPLENPKSKLTPADPINLDKMIENFRKTNIQMHGENWALHSADNQNSVEFKELIEQIELPVLEQVEKPLIEYLTSEEGLKKPEILKLRLHPADLGMVEVRFEKSDSGNIEIHFQAESEIAKEILAEGFDALHDRLRDNGLQIERLEISNSLLSSSGFEAGGENLPEQESIENRDKQAELDDDSKNEDDESGNRNEPERLVNLRA